MDDLDILAAAFASDDDDTPMEDAMLEDGEQSQGTDALEDAHRIQLSMLEEAFADEVVANEFDVAFASDAEDGAEEHAPVSAEQSDAVEPVGRKRGRPRGSKNKPKTQEPENKLSRTERAKRAAEARWKKDKGAVEQELPSPQPDVGSLEAPCEALVPYKEEKYSLALCQKRYTWSEAVIKQLESPSTAAGRTEKDVLAKTFKLCSMSVVGKQMGMSYHTVQSKMRAMASTCLIGSRARWVSFLENLEAHFRQDGRRVDRIMYVVKQAFDGFRIRLRVNDSSSDPAPGETKVAEKNLKKIATVTEMMQACVEHAALYRIDGVHLSVHCSLPCPLKPISNNTAVCIKESLLYSTAAPAIAKHFPDRARISTSDDHKSNHRSDYSRFEDDPFETLIKDLCQSHKQHKIAELLWRCFPADTRGVLNLVLALKHGGAFRDFKKGLRIWLEAKLVVYPYENAHAVEAEQEYRKMVEEMFCQSGDERVVGPKVRQRKERLFTRRKLLNGNLKDWREVQHYCRGQCCCKNRQDTVNQLVDHFVSSMGRPAEFAENRWLGIEDGLDLAGELLCTNYFLVIGVHYAFFGAKTIGVLEERMRQFFEKSGGPESDTDAEFKDTTTEMTTFERQSTYHANIKCWLMTSPMQRLFILRRFVYCQQGSQKLLLRSCGRPWKDAQTEKAMRGEVRLYKPLMALTGDFYKPFMQELGRFLTTADCWLDIPERFQSEICASQGFRAGSRTACATYQLLWVPQRGYPNVAMGILHPDADESLKYARQLIDDYEVQCCVMDPYSFSMVERYSSLNLLLGAEPKAKLRLLALLIEASNAPVEANNAWIRSRIVRAVQQTVPDLLDIQSQWIMQWARRVETGITGELESDEESEAEDNEEAWEEVNKAGGTCRAFLSRYLCEYKFDNNRVDFASCHAAYKALVAAGPSPLLAELEELGEKATKSGQARSKDPESTLQGMSNFGTVSSNEIRKAERDAERHAMLCDHDALVANTQAPTMALQDVTTSTALCIVSKQSRDIITELVQARSGSTLQEQVQSLNYLSYALARREKQKERDAAKELRALVCSEQVVSTLDIAKIQLPSHSRVRLLKDELPRVEWVDLGMKYAASKVESLKGQTETNKRLLDFLEEQSKMVHDDEAPLIKDPSRSYRPTRCFTTGCGRCICRLPGRLFDMSQQALMRTVLAMTPAQSPGRRGFLEGWIFLEINQTGHDDRHTSLWLHVGLCYLNPQRMTVLVMDFVHNDFTGRPVLTTTLQEDGTPNAKVDLEAMQSMDIDIPATVKLWRLVASPRPQVPFTLSGKLVVEPLDAHCHMVTNCFRFWGGAVHELAIEAERERLRKERADKRAAARPPQEAATAEPPRAGPVLGFQHAPSDVEARREYARKAALIAPALSKGVGGADASGAAASFLPPGQPEDPDDTHGDFPDLPGGDGFMQDWSVPSAGLVVNGLPENIKAQCQCLVRLHELV